jgi:hypothetical protein
MSVASNGILSKFMRRGREDVVDVACEIRSVSRETIKYQPSKELFSMT